MIHRKMDRLTTVTVFSNFFSFCTAVHLFLNTENSKTMSGVSFGLNSTFCTTGNFSESILHTKLTRQQQQCSTTPDTVDCTRPCTGRRDGESRQRRSNYEKIRNDESRTKNRSLSYRRRELNILDKIVTTADSSPVS